MSTWEAAYEIGPGPDDPTPTPGEATVATPDPYGTADRSSYAGGDSGPDVPIDYLPPWGPVRAPGTVRTIAAGSIIPIDPWAPIIALLNADQLALLNWNSAARQAAQYFVDDPRQV